MARPLKDIDPKQVELLASCFCTTEEIAAKLGCSKDTLERRFAAVLRTSKEAAKCSLRVMQYTSAKKGSVPMQVWLGKQYLDQKDKHQVSIEDFTDDDLVREAKRRLAASIAVRAEADTSQ